MNGCGCYLFKKLINNRLNMQWFNPAAQLERAIWDRNLPNIIAILNTGLDPNFQINWDVSPIRLAVSRYPDAIHTLVTHGANLAVIYAGGHTVLHIAAMYGRDRSVRILLQHHADVNAINDRRFTPLHCAIEGNHDTSVRILLEHKADVNTRNDRKFTPLHSAAERGRDNAIQLLLANDANEQLMDDRQRIPADLALINGYRRTARLLVAETVRKEVYTADILACQLAFSMGSHRRLGEQSLINNLDPEIINIITTELRRRMETEPPLVARVPFEIPVIYNLWFHAADTIAEDH